MLERKIDMLNVQHISKSFGKFNVLKDISFNVEPGEIVGLVGGNGAGKSTLLNIIATLTKPSSEDITLDGIPFNQKRKKVRKQIGYIPQEIALWDHLSVRENMLFFEKLAWKRKTEKDLRTLCLDMELKKWHEPVNTLSGGQKRKLNMAISFIHEPTLILLDEPTVGIDMKSKQEIITYLKNQVSENNLTVIYTSHDMWEIETLCEKVVCIGQDPFYKNMLAKTGKEIIEFQNV